jgi:hypothetical protein
MKIKINETVLNEFEVEIEDGLTGDELIAAIENAKDQFEGIHDFIQVETWNWDIVN